MTVILGDVSPLDVYVSIRLILWVASAGVTLVAGVFGMQLYIVHLHRRNEETQQRIERRLTQSLIETRGQFQTMVDTAVLMKAMAKSFKKDSERALEGVKEEVKKGVETATQTAANLAAGASPVPPSDPKFPKPLLPEPL